MFISEIVHTEDSFLLKLYYKFNFATEPAKECGLEVGEFIHTFGDAHIYSNHMDAIHTQLSRDSYLPPQLKINTDKSIFDINYEDLELINYESHPAIKAPIAV